MSDSDEGTSTKPAPTVGIIGGSGLYDLLDPATSTPIEIDTPYGRPSGSIAVGEFAGRSVAFLARHGAGHALAPHEINYRANVWALAHLGVSAVVGSTAVGSLAAELRPGTFLIPDQLIDRTWGRTDTFFGSGRVEHLPFADPFCPQLVEAAGRSLRELGESVVVGGTTAVIQGPRFSTRAESRWLRSAGADIVNMTQYPEAALAAELNIGLVNLSFVTDTDAGVEGPEPDADAVDPQLVFERMRAAKPRIIAALAAIVAAIPDGYQARSLVSVDAVDAVLHPAEEVH